MSLVQLEFPGADVSIEDALYPTGRWVRLEIDDSCGDSEMCCGRAGLDLDPEGLDKLIQALVEVRKRMGTEPDFRLCRLDRKSPQ